MKDRKTRRIIILIAFVLAIVVLIAARPPLRSLIFWAEAERQMHETANTPVRWYESLGPTPLFSAKKTTAIVLSEYVSGDNPYYLLPQYGRGMITDEAEIAALLDALRQGAVEYAANLRRAEHVLYLALVADDGEAFPLSLSWTPGKTDLTGEYYLSLPEPSHGCYRITDACAKALLALEETHPTRALSDPAIYETVIVEDLVTGNTATLNEAQIAELVDVLSLAGEQAIQRYQSRMEPMEPEQVIRIRFTDGGSFCLGHKQGGEACVLFPAMQIWEDDYDYEAEVYTPHHMNGVDPFTDEVDYKRLQHLHYLPPSYNDLSALLAQFLGQ